MPEIHVNEAGRHVARHDLAGDDGSTGGCC